MNLEPFPSPLPNRTVDGEAFATGLKHALEAVVRVSIATSAGESCCTGWLIAPRLVIFPAYALADTGLTDAAARITLQRLSVKGWEGHPDTKTPVDRLEADFSGNPPGSMDLAILHLDRAHAIPRLRFRREPPEPEELALIVHHGMGTRGARLSFTEVREAAGLRLQYDGLHQPGSGGAILYDTQWRFLGVHMMSTPDSSAGASQAAVMAMLQRSRWWDQIAHHQGLANVVAVRNAAEAPVPAPVDPSPELIRAALRFSIVRDALGEAERAALAPHVVDASASRWTLSPRVRYRILSGVPLEDLVKRIPELDEADRKIIEPILKQDPDALEQAGEDELARWLQAVRWFGGPEPGLPALVPGLPSPARIYQLLQRRRVRGRLVRIAGGDFVGRRDELVQMQHWFDSRSDAPVSIWGMGGIGKSALVARFLGELPSDTVLLWLDFDQAALAPDDEASIIAALYEQAAAQVEGGTPAPTGAAAAAGMGDADDDAVKAARDDLVRLLGASPGRRIVIMLDSFEAAQYAERHQELWPVLEDLTREVAGIQVIVSGRAQVPTLRLHGVPAISIRLTGLDADDARAWLGRHGVPPGPVQDEVVRVAVGLPLVLKLAEHLVAAGGDLSNLPERLPDVMVAGVLYDRILDRVHNPAYKNVAKCAIVLRCLRAEMVEPVFGGLPLVLPDGPVSSWFSEFAREAALVEGEVELRLRSEVRAAALGLLERQEPDLVREIDRRALAWYGTRDTNEPAVAAERVYHALRLDDIAGAMEAWRDGCANHLQYAEETLRGAAREWLSQRMGTSGSIAGEAVEVWEQEAADRISQVRAAGRPKGAIGILLERAERFVGGALAFHEAYEDWVGGRRDAALARLLQHGIDPADRRARDRAMLAALIHAERGDRTGAVEILNGWSDAYYWQDRKDGLAERAAVHAAEVCLCSPLELEQQIGARGAWPAGVHAMDLLLEEGRTRSTAGAGDASVFGIALPVHASERRSFLANLEKFREVVPGMHAPSSRFAGANVVHEAAAGAYAPQIASDPAGELLSASWQRWNTLADGAMVQVLEEALTFQAISPLEQSVVTVLALFAGIPGLELRLRERSLEGWLSYMRSRVLPSKGRGRAALNDGGAAGHGTSTDVRILRQRALEWCGPDVRPLRQLVQRFAGKFEEK